MNPHDDRIAVDAHQERAQEAEQMERKARYSEPPRKASFWQKPLGDFRFARPPLPKEFQKEWERPIDVIRQILHDENHPQEMADLDLNTTILLRVPAEEYDEVRRELEPRLQELESRTRASRNRLEAIQQSIISQPASTGVLPLPTRPGELILPQHLAKALREALPTDEELSGQYGVVPPEEESVLQKAGRWLFEMIAPLTAGLMLGVNTLVIMGFLHLEDFRRGEQLWLVALATLVGLVIEKLIGEACYQLTRSFAQSCEQPLTTGGEPFPHLRSEWMRAAFSPFVPMLEQSLTTNGEPFPRLQLGWMRAVFSPLILLLSAAVALVDALGLRILHEESIRETELLGVSLGALLPFWVYLIAGCIASMPYLLYKATRGWRTAEEHLRRARYEWLRRSYLKQLISTSAVQEALVQAQETAVLLHHTLPQLEAEQETAKERLDAARVQAIGCLRQFLEYWNQLLADQQKGGWLSHWLRRIGARR